MTFGKSPLPPSEWQPNKTLEITASVPKFTVPTYTTDEQLRQGDRTKGGNVYGAAVRAIEKVLYEGEIGFDYHTVELLNKTIQVLQCKIKP